MRKLEETFNLPSMQLPEIDAEEIEEVDGYTADEMMQLMARADKIDAALPQVAGLDKMDADYDNYARKSIAAFDDLIELGKNVEDRHSAEIFNAASSMMGNALNAKTNKAQKKLEVVKLQIQKAKLELENEKLDYLKKRHLKVADGDDPEETTGQIIATRNDVLNEILASMKKDDES
jgi:hypothetical protein